jgi:WD40 repeat protein
MTVQVRDVVGGRCLSTLEGHTGSVRSVALSADGRTAVSLGEDKTIRVWFLDWELEDGPPTHRDDRAFPVQTSIRARLLAGLKRGLFGGR